MLGFPCLLFPVSSAAPGEIDFVNDVRTVLHARLNGLDNLSAFVMLEGFFHAVFAVINLNLSTLATRAAVVGVGVGVFLAAHAYENLVGAYLKRLWHGSLASLRGWRCAEPFMLEVQKSAIPEQGEQLLQRQREARGAGASLKIHWPKSALKYRDGQCILPIFVADQAHRYLSVFWFGVAGVASFALLAPVTAGLYSVCMGALFLFQQEGLRIYPKSPRLYHLLDIAFKGGALFAAVCHPELLFFSCRLTQVVFIAYVVCDTMYSLPKLLLGEGFSLNIGRGTKRC